MPEEPVPEPELLGSAKPPELELPLPVQDEPVPEPELLGSARPPELEVPLPVEDEPVPGFFGDFRGLNRSIQGAATIG